MIPHPSFHPAQVASWYRAYTSAFIDAQNQASDVGITPLADSICVKDPPHVVETSANGVGDISRVQRHALTDPPSKSSFEGGSAE
jgi:hypothetical protein